MCSWSSSSSTLAGTSSATRISGGVGTTVVPSGSEERRAGPDDDVSTALRAYRDAEAERPRPLGGAAARGVARRTLQGEVERGAPLREREAEPAADRVLADLDAVRRERQRAHPNAGAHLHHARGEARAGDVGAGGVLPRVGRLHRRRAESVERRPALPVGARRERRAGDAVEAYADSVAVGHVRL